MENCFNVIFAQKDQIVAEENVTRIKNLICDWFGKLSQLLHLSRKVFKKFRRILPRVLLLKLEFLKQDSRGTGRTGKTGGLDVHLFRQGESGNLPETLKYDFTQEICLTERKLFYHKGHTSQFTEKLECDSVDRPSRLNL